MSMTLPARFPRRRRRARPLSNRYLAGLLPLLIAFAPSAGAQQSTPVDTLEDGSIIFSVTDDADRQLTPEEKIAELNERLKKNPADGRSWNDLGVLYAQQQRYDIARDAFIKAVQADPTQGDFHRNLGLAFSKLGMYDLALAEFEAYRRNDAMGGLDYWRLIGSAQLAAGQTEAARQTYQEGIDSLSPALGEEGLRLVLNLYQLENEMGDSGEAGQVLAKYTPVARDYLRHNDDESDPGRQAALAVVHNRVARLVDDGQLLEKSGLLAEAAGMYREAYDLAPERDDLLPRLVDVYIALDEPMQARVAARLAREDHPDKAGTWIAAGRIYENDRRLEDAVEAYRKAFAIDPSIEDLRVAIGNLLLRLGRDKEAAEFLKEGVNTADTKPEVVYNYAISLIKEKKYNAAIPSLRTVVRERPQMGSAWEALAQCLRATKQYGAAVEPYQQALALQPKPNLAYNLGYCAMKAKRYDTAVAAYQQALEMDPGFVEARYNLSLTFMNAGRYTDAVASFDRLLEMEPNSYRAYYSQGLSYYYLGEYDKALECYDLALEQNETVNVLNNIGLVYDKLGKKKEAQKYYKSAQDLKKGKKNG